MSVISGTPDNYKFQLGSSPSSIASYQSEHHYNNDSSSSYLQTTTTFHHHNNHNNNSPEIYETQSILSGGDQTIMTTFTNATNATNATILPPDQANINFKPTTTAVSKVHKLKLHVLLDSTIYTAGGILTGRLVLTSATSKSLKLGEISCELTAYEELNTREYTASQSFLSSRLVFQSSNLPPSNAVHGPPLNGYWTAKKGKTTFPFAFKIPIDAPSSMEYGSNASLRYIVTGVIQFMNNGKQDTIFKSKGAFVVEAWDRDNSIYRQPIDAVNMKQLWMGGSGAVLLEATLIETLFQSGGNVSIKVRVKNDTKRRVQGIKVAITKKLLILANKIKKEVDQVKIVGETVSEEWFKNKDFLFDCGEDRSTTVHIHVPKNIRTIRNTALFEVICHVVVSLYLGPLTKDLTVVLPVYIAHSASLQPAPVADADLNHFPNHYNMMDENVDFFIEDVRKDDNEILEYIASPVNIPSKKGNRSLPWSNEEEGYHRGRHSPPKNSFGSSLFGSASPKKFGSFAQSLLGKPKQMSPSSPSKLIAKSPPLAPASPYAYIPAIERVRYLSFTTQEQTAIQKRPFTPTRSALSNGINNNVISERNGLGSLAESEYGYNVSPPKPLKMVQKWLDNQNDDSPPEVPNPIIDPIDKTNQPTKPSSQWSHINHVQEVITKSPSNKITSTIDQSQQISVPIPIQNNSNFSDKTFQRNNSIVSSPPGPSGITLLMNNKSPKSSVLDTFEDKSLINSTKPSNDYVSKEEEDDDEEGDDKSIVIINEDNIPKSNYLQLPKDEQVRSRTPPPPPLTSNTSSDTTTNSTETAIGGVGVNLSTLLKWGGSWIGYSNSPEYNKNNNQENEKNDNNLDSNEIIATDETIVDGKQRKELPPPPGYATESVKARAIKVEDIVRNGQTGEIESEILNNEGLIVRKTRKILPPPPEDATDTKKARAIKVDEYKNIQDVFNVDGSSENTSQITNNQNEQNVLSTEVRPQRNLPPIPKKLPSLQNIKNKEPNESEIVPPPIIESEIVPPSTIESEINLSSTLVNDTTKIRSLSSSPPVPPKPPKPSYLSASPPSQSSSHQQSKNISSSPPKSSPKSAKPSKPVTTNQNFTKASIFAALGQRKLPISKVSNVISIPNKKSSPPPKPIKIKQSSPIKQSPPIKQLPPTKHSPPTKNSPPIKQSGFNVPRKPISQNNILKEPDVNIGKGKESTNGIKNVDSEEINEQSKNIDNHILGENIIPSESKISPSPKKSSTLLTITSSDPIPTANLTRKKTFRQHKLEPMLPTLSQTTLTKPNNENTISEEEEDYINTETSKFSSSPMSQYSKITSKPTTYVNNTIAKPSKKNKKFEGNEKDENKNKNKIDIIIEPPKQVLSPRLQEYISKYNKATTGGM
ncbi:hypothetical protein Glove_134g84 [Diversispora epigaea]|uniref:Arrestin C-terminal-like domain-containing protein n=1 Tax=Diversispora epigaea TaxID=1348612 RepID=A0A397J0Y6_9GLOM|nr:hypothetical protein Glove_134g84 [Diversispora epigaea]